MTAHQILSLLFIALVLFILPPFGSYFMFKKAGVPAWKGLVPVLNTYEMLRYKQKTCLLVFPAVYSCSGLVYYVGDISRICKNFWQVSVLPACPDGFFSRFIFYLRRAK